MRLSEEKQIQIVHLRQTTTLNLAEIAEKVGTSRTSAQRVCQKSGLGNLGRRNRWRAGKKFSRRRRKPVISLELAGCRQSLRSYKNGAIHRGLVFELSETECLLLFAGRCHYCGALPREKRHFNRVVRQNGIDRRDSSIGYISDNCVSCCTLCNYAKRNLSVEEFKKWIVRLVLHQLNGKGEWQ